MQKAVFKQQFEAFKISNSEGLEKGYDRFQQLLSQLEAHGAEVSTEDANHKFLRSLPPAWSNLAMTMRTNPKIDTLSIDDLYNNLRVFDKNSRYNSSDKGLLVNQMTVKDSFRNTSEHSFKTESESLSVPNEMSTSRLVEHPLKNMVDRGIFDSGCSGHMTGNKDQLEDFEEFNGGSVTFGGSKGYISGKGKIRVGNLDFDSVSFVKELGHFNLFPSNHKYVISSTKVLFTELECLVVSSDFKMPDENQNTLKDSMNYIPVSLENQANPHAGYLEKTNNAGTSQTSKSNASEEKYEDVELIVVPSAVKRFLKKELTQGHLHKVNRKKKLDRPSARGEGNLVQVGSTEIKEMKRGVVIGIKQDWWPKDKYVAEILKKFDLVNVKAAITPMETKVPLTKDEEAIDVDVFLDRSMIGKPPKTSHSILLRNLQYLKGKPNLGLCILGNHPLTWKHSLDSRLWGSQP
ncbi:hypothetical protein Tco_0169913 [Tanacetum coccineum]